jgi:hypothetical protein
VVVRARRPVEADRTGVRAEVGERRAARVT